MRSFFAIASIEMAWTLVLRFLASMATVSQNSMGHRSVTRLIPSSFAVIMSFVSFYQHYVILLSICQSLFVMTAVGLSRKCVSV